MVTMHLTMFLLLLATLPGSLAMTRTDMHFMGGSMMFKFIDTTKAPYKLKVTTLTGWVHGQGPCGKTCTIADIGRDTTATRRDMLALYGDAYFGNWTKETRFFGNRIRKYERLTPDIIGKIEGHVTGVNLPMQWEQELSDVIMDINPTTEYIDIKISSPKQSDVSWRGIATTSVPSLHGSYWRWFNYTFGVHSIPVSYRLQIKVKPERRDDTKEPNNSPLVIFKPVYRILLNKATTIQLSPIDPDGDIVTCAYAEFVQAGGLRDLNNTVVNQDCSIVIDAQESAGFLDGGWGAIPVQVTDSKRNPKLHHLAFNDINVQFMIQTLKTIDSPEFVNPTEESGHQFIVYVGSTLKIPLYAKPMTVNEINAFYLRSIPYQHFNVDPPQVDNGRKGEGIKYTIVKWRPGKSDVGVHVFSALVTDTNESDGFDRVYSIIVKDIALPAEKEIPNSGPYFPLFPDRDRVVCMLRSTCSFPIYTNTKTPGGFISAVDYTTSTFTTTTIDHPEPIKKDGVAMFVSVVTVNPSKSGDHRICLETTDDKGNTSAIKCLTVEVKIPDPCFSHPCVHGTCSSGNDSFVCSCDRLHTGRNCENEIDFCAAKPCLNNGRCTQSEGHLRYQCDCSGTGYVGMNCETDEIDCKLRVCGPHGVCRDLNKQFECDCYNGYSGDDCKTINNTCKDVACKNGGICIEEAASGLCKCPIGFSGPDCHDVKKSQQVNSGTKDNPFFVPSLANGAEMKCFVGHPCTIPVFAKAYSGVHTSLHSREVTALIRSASHDYFTDLNTEKFLLDITPNSIGMHTVCIKTRGINPDTLCYKVDAKPYESYNDRQLLPRFKTPTPPDQSIINCIQGTPCHVIITTNFIRTVGICTLYTGSTSAVTFTALLYGPGNNDCETDVLFNPPATGDKEVCLYAGPKLTLGEKRFQGEKRCFTIKTTATDNCNPNPCHNGGACILQPGETPPFQCLCPDTTTGDLCQHQRFCTNTSCQNGGFCGVHGTVYDCKCPVGYGGHKCDPITPSYYTLFTDPTLNNGATIFCEVGETCDIQVFLSAESFLLDAGPSDKDVDVDIWKHIGKPAANRNEDLLRVTPLTVGILNVCIVATSNDSVTRQSICYHIEANQGHLSLGSDDFKPPTLPAGSTIPCAGTKHCHVIMYSRPDGHKCQQVENLGSAGLDLHIFPSRLEGGSCVTDVMFSSDAPTGTRRLCLGLGTSSLRCYKVDPNTAEPCKNQNCGHGACIVEGNNYSCVCDEKHRGTACEHDTNVPIIG